MDYVVRFEAKLSWTKHRLLLPKTLPKSFLRKTRFRSKLFYETALSPISRAKRTMWCVSRQNCSGRKLRSLLHKTPPKSFFRKTRFWSEFFYETTPSPIFRAKWTMWRVSRQNCPGRKYRSLLPKTPSKSFFRKTRFRSEFFYKTAPSHIFGAKRTIWRISR